MFKITQLFRKKESENIPFKVMQVFQKLSDSILDAEHFNVRNWTDTYLELISLVHLDAVFCQYVPTDKNTWINLKDNAEIQIAVTSEILFLVDETFVYSFQKKDPLFKRLLPLNENHLPIAAEAVKLGNGIYFLFILFSTQNELQKLTADGLLSSCRLSGKERRNHQVLIGKEKSFKQISEAHDQLLAQFRSSERALRRRAYEINNILEISNELYALLDLDRLMNAALLVMVGQLGCEKAFALLSHPDKGDFAQQFSKGFGSSEILPKMDWDHPLVTYLFKRKQPVYAEDLFQLPQLADIATVSKQNGVYLLAPLIHADHMHGIIGCGVKIFTGVFDPEDIQMFSILINIISVSISNARMYESVKLKSLTDAMTNLNNYRSFEERLKAEINRANRRNNPLSLIMLDIDNFKNYNDSLGHPAGDQALRQLGRILKEVSRDEDVVNRYGGEEFSIILPDLPKESVHVLAERIRKQVEQEVFFREDVQPGGRLTISLGGATLPIDANDFDQLVRCADEALYYSKEHGRNRFTLYSKK